MVKVSFHQELIEQNCMACHSDHQGPKLAQHSRKPFSHALLRTATKERCASCHTAPKNDIHRDLTVGCGQCHKSDAWKPATFEHAKLFVLDQDHNASCVTCHAGTDFSRYTCYGCHEHTLAKVRREHQDEGIQNFENCVECHRSASGEPEGRDKRKGDGEGRNSASSLTTTPRATFGLPCPTTIFTIGLLAFAVAPYPRSSLVVPVLWCFVGAQAAFLLNVPQDLGLVVAGVVGIALLASAKRKPPAVPGTQPPLQ